MEVLKLLKSKSELAKSPLYLASAAVMNPVLLGVNVTAPVTRFALIIQTAPIIPACIAIPQMIARRWMGFATATLENVRRSPARTSAANLQTDAPMLARTVPETSSVPIIRAVDTADA